MSVGVVGENPAISGNLPQEESWGFWDFLSPIFALLTTRYNMDHQEGLYIYKSGGHLINEGVIEGTYSLTLNYNSVINRGSISSHCGDLTIHADKLTLDPGSTIEGNTLHFDARKIEINGADVIAKESLKVTLCQEIILRGISSESPTWQVLDHLPSGCIKTITTT